MYPEVSKKVESHQARQKEFHDNEKPLREFTQQDPVYIENFTTRKPKWIPGTIVKVTGPLSYVIELRDGTTVRRHVDSIRKRESPVSDQDTSTVMSGSELVQVPVGPTTKQEDSTTPTRNHPESDADPARGSNPNPKP